MIGNSKRPRELPHYNCEFCAEFAGIRKSRFSEIYGSSFQSRVVTRTEHFVAIPTLGQIFDGSLLVLPVEHVETCAKIASHLRAEFASFVNRLLHDGQSIGYPIFFEHGAVESSSGGCGLYHAHLHLVPLPRAVELTNIFSDATLEAPSLVAALDALRKSSEYLLIGDGRQVISRDVERSGGNFPSQYFRRRLVEVFGINRPWNWREFQRPEAGLLKTIRHFSVSHVSERSSNT